MWVVFIVIIMCLLIVAVGIQSGSSSSKSVLSPHDKATLKIEFPRRKQILEESVRLIQNTTNLDTLLSRYETALENSRWIMDQKNKGLPIYFHTEEEGFESALNRIRNYHIVRLAMEKFINYKFKMYGLKTVKAKDDNTAKMFEFVDSCIVSLKPHANKFESRERLDKIRCNVEDFYSDISLEKKGSKR